MNLYRSTAVHVIYPPPSPSTPLHLSPAKVTPQFLIWNENENLTPLHTQPDLETKLNALDD